MRHTRPLALALSVAFGVTALAGTAFSETSEEGTAPASKSGRTSKQALAILDRYEADQDRIEAERLAYDRALAEREKFLAGVAAAEQARQQEAAAAARRERASRAAAAARPAAAAAPATRAPAYGPWADLINQYPWPTDTAYRVMMCESKGDANAYNPRSGATGLFQILDGPYDPAENVALAFRMWQSRGWQPWRACV